MFVAENVLLLLVISLTVYIDGIMTTIVFKITSLTVVYSTVQLDVDQRKHQSSASLAFVWEIHRDRWIPRTKGQLRGKCFHLMTSWWCMKYRYDKTNGTPFFGENIIHAESLFTGKYGSYFKSLIFKHMLWIKSVSASSAIALRRMTNP